jgi:membrane protease YdiL (CAAX protease family)
VKIGELIGGRWESVEDFLLDIAIAIGFWLVALIVLGGLGYLLGLTKGAQAGEAKKLVDMLGPDTPQALAMFILLSTVAGFVEEIIFRGYFQRQFAALTGSAYAGLIIQAVLFGAGHGYEGARRMLLIVVFGAMFGVLTLWRKSLRPGMMAHALHDSLAGVGLYLVKRGFIPMR